MSCCADTYVPGPPFCTYGLRVPASCVLYVPEAQGSLPWGGHYCTYAVRVPAPGVPYVPRTVAPQALPWGWGDNQRTVARQIETERGWLHNDTSAVRALLPGARVNLGDDRRPHLAAPRRTSPHLAAPDPDPNPDFKPKPSPNPDPSHTPNPRPSLNLSPHHRPTQAPPRSGSHAANEYCRHLSDGPLTMVKCPPYQCPSSLPLPSPQGTPGGSGQLGTPRVRPSHWARSHRLGGSSERPPKSPIPLPLTLQAPPASRGGLPSLAAASR